MERHRTVALGLALCALPALSADLTRGDFTGNGFVNVNDYNLFRRCIGISRPDCAWADLNDDGYVTTIDFSLFKKWMGFNVYWETVGGPIYTELHTGPGAPGTRLKAVLGAAPGFPCQPLTFGQWNTVQAGPYPRSGPGYVWGMVPQGFTLCEAYSQVVHFAPAEMRIVK
jgi:hypothetical protein